MLHLSRIRLLPITMAAIVALLLVKSALLAQAVAQEAAASARAADTMPPPPQAAPVVPVAQAPPMTVPAPKQEAVTPETGTAPATPPVSEAERAVLLDLRQRRQALEARAKELDQRAAEMEAADRRLNDRVQQLAALQTRLETLEAEREKHKAENWAGLVKIYEAMKPREAAAIFDSLDMQVLLQVLDRMQERRVAPILAAMQPDRARLATQLLAEMRTKAITPAPASPSPPDPKG